MIKVITPSDLDDSTVEVKDNKVVAIQQGGNSSSNDTGWKTCNSLLADDASLPYGDLKFRKNNGVVTIGGYVKVGDSKDLMVLPEKLKPYVKIGMLDSYTGNGAYIYSGNGGKLSASKCNTGDVICVNLTYQTYDNEITDLDSIS